MTNDDNPKRPISPNMPRPQLPFEFPPMLGQKAARYDFIMGWMLALTADGQESIDAVYVQSMIRESRKLYPIRGEYNG